MKRLIILLLITARAVQAQTIAEFRQWYLDKQITNPALLANAADNNVLLSFSPGRYTLNYPTETYTFKNYQFLASGTYSAANSGHHFGAYVWGQQEATNSFVANYAYEMPISRNTNLAFGANLGVYKPIEFDGGKDFRYGAGVALQSKNKENYVGLSFPHIVTGVYNGKLSQGAYKALILQGGYTFYLTQNIRFIPAAYLQVDVIKNHGPAGPGQFFAADLAFKYKDFIYVNAAGSVKNFNFKTTALQRFGAGIMPQPNIMIGYQRDALDGTDFRYHSIWVRYSFLARGRRVSRSKSSGINSNNSPAVVTPQPIKNSPTPSVNTSRPEPPTPKPTVSTPDAKKNTSVKPTVSTPNTKANTTTKPAAKPANTKPSTSKTPVKTTKPKPSSTKPASKTGGTQTKPAAKPTTTKPKPVVKKQ